MTSLMLMGSLKAGGAATGADVSGGGVGSAQPETITAPAASAHATLLIDLPALDTFFTVISLSEIGQPVSMMLKKPQWLVERRDDR
jgi:hypothetical protein